MNPTFSIITPTRNRDGRYGRGSLDRCLKSVANQTYPKELYEHIIVDDGNESGGEVINRMGVYRVEGVEFKIIRHDAPTERYIAYNDGLKAVKNDWIVFLDDDDEYVPFYLEYIADAIKRFPDSMVFNYGGLVTHKKEGWMRARPVFKFEQIVGAPIESGQIVNGQFCFHKSCLEKTGLFPDTSNLWRAYDEVGIPGYGSEPGMKPLGNPWGQDFLMMWRLTRHWISKPLDLFLYICHLRGTE